MTTETTPRVALKTRTIQTLTFFGVWGVWITLFGPLVVTLSWMMLTHEMSATLYRSNAGFWGFMTVVTGIATMGGPILILVGRTFETTVIEWVKS